MKYLIIISLLSICLLSCQEQNGPQYKDETARGKIAQVNESIAAGDNIFISGTFIKGVELQSQPSLVLHYSLYTKSYPLKVNDQKFIQEIPGIDNQLAGEVICRLVYHGQIISEEKIFIKPLTAIDKMQNFNGPKSLFANDDDGSMNISIPHDQYGNPLLPPTKVNYQSSFNGKIENIEQKEIKHLISYQINSSKKQNGKYLIGSGINEGFSQEQELIIGAAMPESFNIKLISHHPFADSRQYIHIKTSVLKDNFDNIVADGTMLNFTVEESEELVGVYQAFCIGGIANVYIENPSRETEWKITAGLHNQIISNELVVSFSKNVNDYNLEWDKTLNRLTIGPVIGVLGQLAPDGTEIRISAKEKGLEDFSYLDEGKASYSLAFDWLQKEPTQLEILIGGLLKTIEIE